jgi:hypothetical protein
MDRCCIGDGGVALRSRLVGGGCKPPQAASVKSRGSERCGKGGRPARQVGTEKASGSEPLLTCRNAMSGIKTEVYGSSRDEPGGYLLTAQVVPGMEVARARSRLRCGTWEPVAPIVPVVHWVVVRCATVSPACLTRWARCGPRPSCRPVSCITPTCWDGVGRPGTAPLARRSGQVSVAYLTRKLRVTVGAGL